MIGFEQVAQFDGVGNATSINNPTSLQFGPDGRLYVAQQNGTIQAFSLEQQENGRWEAVDVEVLTLASGEEVVRSILNHNDDGTANSAVTDRQVTGIVVSGTAEAPVLYVTSSDPRISFFGDSGLDTNSGVLTRVSWTGSAWETVDLIRGLPRSEENHGPNGLALDGDTLYVNIGGNTNNGAPSAFFSYTAEYALAGAILAVDLSALEEMAVLTDANGGQNGARAYVYDLPTLDDPNRPNDGVLESLDGLDVNGPWGGNDGLNQAVLPADAPLRIYAEGLRNQYDLVLTASGLFYTVDNGSNPGVGDVPIEAGGEATNEPNNGGNYGNGEPLFLLEDGGYYGHPNPTRANQDQAWTVLDDDGNPDESLAVNSVPDISALVPDGVAIADGFLIDPSKFTDDAARLLEAGIAVPYDDPASPALVVIGSSSNGLVEYTSDAFDGALQGDLLVAQFNGQVGRLDLSEDGTAASYETIPGLSGFSIGLDVTTGPDGTVWVAELGADQIRGFAPGEVIYSIDFDADGLVNAVDPFQRDPDNGFGSILPIGGQLVWDFDPNQDGNLVGPSGFGGGLTGVLVDGETDFEAFFSSASDLPNQSVQLDNVKFITAAGGGTTVIENVSNGDPFKGRNDGTFLFQTGAAIPDAVNAFDVTWSVYNPTSDWAENGWQQIGGYIGPGDQDNYLKIVAITGHGGMEVLLENEGQILYRDVVETPGLFGASADAKISFTLRVDKAAQTVMPTMVFDTASGGQETVTGEVFSIANTTVLDAIMGTHEVDGFSTSLALGLISSNHGVSPSETFQAVFDDIVVADADPVVETVLFRVNAGGPTVAAIDDGPDWIGQNSAQTHPDYTGTSMHYEANPLTRGDAFSDAVPDAVLGTGQWEPGAAASQMAYDFDVEDGRYRVKLILGDGYGGTSAPGDRVFSVGVEGEVPRVFQDIDMVAGFGDGVAGVLSTDVEVSDGVLNLTFEHGVENPSIRGLEIARLDDPTSGSLTAYITPGVESVQFSTFANGSFTFTNSGGKDIASVTIDATTALFPDLVFDPFGLAGDTVAKQLTINSDGNTGVVDPGTYDPYIGAGGSEGFDQVVINFDPEVNGGFNPGETLVFALDMDHNSIAGATKVLLEQGTDPFWDVGGVSGAELSGTTFTVTFTDGSTAEGAILADGSQAGGAGIAEQGRASFDLDLTVEGLREGGVGTYSAAPQVIVDGPAGETARVVLTQAMIQPVENVFFDGDAEEQIYAVQLQAQLDALAASDFPANNAVRFQTVDIELTGSPQDITPLFDFTSVPNYETADEDKLPLGFTAAVIDPDDGNLPLGPLTKPIYLTHDPDHVPVGNADGFVFALNAGGDDYVASDGTIYAADTFGAGNSFSTSASIAGTDDDVLFQSETWKPGGFIYEIDVENGTYDVELLFAEIWGGAFSEGGRVFDVQLEGNTILDDLDIYTSVGQNTALVTTHRVTVTDGSLTLSTSDEVQNPKIAAFSIWEVLEG